MAAQIILPVMNGGDTWIEVSAIDSDYSIYAPDGSVLRTGIFLWAVPRLLPPGATGYLVAEEFGTEFPASDYDRVEATGGFADATTPTATLEVQNTRLQRDSLGYIEVTGEVANPGTALVDYAELGAIFIDGGRKVLGFVLTYVDDIEAGGRKAFQVDTNFANVALEDIGDTLFFASDAGD